MGAVINDETIGKLKCKVVAGAANNQLAEAKHGEILREMGILYAPDFVINGGGLINVYGELKGWPMDRAKRKAGEIYDAILKVLAIAKRDGIPSFEAADRVAEERLDSVRGLQRMWLA